MEGWEIVVVGYAVAGETQSVDGFRIKQRQVKCVEYVVGNNDTGSVVPSVEICGLGIKFGNYRIDRDHSLCKLEHVSQGVDEAVACDGDVAAGSGFEPSVAVAA